MKFQRTVDRIMTPAEAQAKCEEMCLHEAYPNVVKFIVGEFERANNEDEHQNICGGHHPAGECDRIVGIDGRLACGQSWEYVYERLAQTFGFTAGEARALVENVGAFPFVDTAWNEFFQE